MKTSIGKTTSEYAVQQKASGLSVILIGLGILVAAGAGVVTALTEVDPTLGVIAGSFFAILGIIHKTFVDLGYIKSRAEVKKAEAAPKDT